MKALIKASIAACAIFLISSTSGFAATAQQQSCGLLNSLSSGDLRAQLNGFLKLTSHWTQSSKNNLQNNARSALQNAKIIGGELYLIGDFGQNMQDHMLIIRNAPGGVAYVRLVYEWAPNEPRLEHITFEDHIAVILRQAIPQAPKKLNCG